MNWDEFIERYVNNFEEFRFKYKNFIIDLLYSDGGTKFAYYISKYVENESLLQSIRNRKEYLDTKKFGSPEELISQFLFDGKDFKTIWHELEWK